MTTIADRERRMMTEYRASIPSDVRKTLESAGFKPELDAGNLWFLDYGPYRLVFGLDGSDLPTSLADPVTICRKGVHDDFGVDFDTLANALDGIAQV